MVTSISFSLDAGFMIGLTALFNCLEINDSTKSVIHIMFTVHILMVRLDCGHILLRSKYNLLHELKVCFDITIQPVSVKLQTNFRDITYSQWNM